MIYCELLLLVLVSLVLLCAACAAMTGELNVRGLAQSARSSQLSQGVVKMKNVIRAGLATVSAVVGSAMAAVPAGVTTAIGDAATDAGTVAGACLLVAVAIFGFIALRRAIK